MLQNNHDSSCQKQFVRARPFVKCFKSIKTPVQLILDKLNKCFTHVSITDKSTEFHSSVIHSSRVPKTAHEILVFLKGTHGTPLQILLFGRSRITAELAPTTQLDPTAEDGLIVTPTQRSCLLQSNFWRPSERRGKAPSNHLQWC